MTTFSRRDRNTGSLGPEARSIFDEELKAWADLEMNPVSKAYWGTVNKLAEKTRDELA